MSEDVKKPNEVQERFQSFVDSAPVENGRVKRTYTFGELWEEKDDEQKFLLPELLPSAAVAVLIGEDGIGKTQLMIQLCLAIALNFPAFMGVTLNCVTNRALVVATEESKRKFIKAAAKQLPAMREGVNPKSVKIQFTEGADFEDYAALIVEIEECCKEVAVRSEDGKTIVASYDLIVIDAMSDLFTLLDGEINSNKDARRIIAALQSICTKYNTTIVLIHHAAKTKLVAKQEKGKLFIDKNDQQGAGAITQKPRTVLALTHDARTIIDDGLSYKNFLHVVKANSMSKHHVNNTLELNFNARTLLHTFCAITDRESYERNNAPSTTPQVESKPQAAVPDITAAAPREVHEELLRQVFSTTLTLKRSDLVDRLKHQYGVGANKIEAANTGILAQLLAMNLIAKDGRSDYRFTPTQYQPEARIPFDENDVPPPADPEEKTPF